MISIKKHAVRIILFSVISFVMWGCGGGTPSIKNGEPVTGLSGTLDTVKTYKISIPENTVGLMIQLRGSSDIQAELFNNDDESVLICSPQSACVLSSPSAGSYELKLTATGDYDNVTLAAAWGGPTESLLQNDVPVSGLEAPAQSILLSALFMMEENQLVSLNTAGMDNTSVQVLDSTGQLLQECVLQCDVNAVLPGLYFVAVSNELAYSAASLTASWGLAQNTTLDNGRPKRGLSGSQGERLSETLYFPTQADALMLYIEAGSEVTTEITDQQGNVVHVCNGGGDCFAPGLPPGLYTLWFNLESDLADFSVTAAWGGKGMASLQDRDQKAWDQVEVGDFLLDTFEVPADAEFVAIAPLSGTTHQMVFTQNGEYIETCVDYQPCVLKLDQVGPYFVKSEVEWVPEDQRIYVAFNLGGQAYSSLGWRGRKDSIPVPESGYVIETFSAQSSDVRGAFSASYGSLASIYGVDGNWVECASGPTCVLSFENSTSFIAYIREDRNNLEQIGFAFSTWSTEAGSLGHLQQKQVEMSPESSVLLETFSVPDDVTSFMVVAPVGLSGDEAVPLEVYEVQTNSPVAVCYGDEPCIVDVSGFNATQYYVASYGEYIDQQTNVRLSVTYAGVNYNTLGNGEFNNYNVLDYGYVTESLTLPTDLDGLRLKTSDYSTLSLYSVHGEAVCRFVQDCLVRGDTGNVYFAVTTLMDKDGYLVTNALAYGAGGVASMQSGDMLQSAVPLGLNVPMVQSFYVPEENYYAMFAAEHSGRPVFVSIDDLNSRSWCESDNHCVANVLAPGLYFVSMVVPAVDANAPLNYSLLLASEQDVTVDGVGSFYGLELEPGQTHLSSFVVSDQTDFMLSSATSEFSQLKIYDFFGAEYDSADLLGGLMPGVYFAAWTPLENNSNVSAGYTIALGGESDFTLQRGKPNTVPLIADGRTVIQSFSIPKGVESLLLKASGDVADIRLYNSKYSRGPFQSCVPNSLCLLNSPLDGTYFVHSVMPNYPASEQDKYSVTMQYVSPESGGSMVHGQIATLDELEEGDVWIESFYVEDSGVSLAFATSYNTNFILVDAYGGDVLVLSPGANDHAGASYNVESGGYYAIMERNPNYQASAEQWFNNYSAKVLWGNTPTMTNGGIIETGNDHVVLESFLIEEGAEPNYPDIYAGMVNYTVQIAETNIYSETDYSLGNVFWEPSRFNISQPGLYYVSSSYVSDYPHRDIGSLSLAWGGPKGTSLENGEVYKTPAFDSLSFSLQSIYLEEQTTLTFNSPDVTFIDSYNYLGEQEVGCIIEPNCQLTLDPGLHFIRFFMEGPSEGATYQAVW
ncbi:MAG: hypothetical protein CMK89_22145 [Pseudomonadales bacterium]|nr:hypothetical protein [Pseudomonadales bacterium]